MASYSKLARRLSDIKRLHMHQLRKPQSVAEHSYNLAMFLHKAASVLNASNSPAARVDLTYLLERALFHDLPEAVTGDIPWPTKKVINELLGSDKGSSYEQVERILMWEKAGILDSDAIQGSIWGNSSTHQLEDHLVEFGDMLELFLTMQGEVELGNSDVEYVLDKATQVAWARYNYFFSQEVRTLLFLTEEVAALVKAVNTASLAIMEDVGV